MSFDRRKLILGASATSAALWLPGPRPWAQVPTEDPFALGVASGDPAPDGFVIWTRLAPKPLEFGGGMPHRVTPVRWEVADDDGFRRIVASGDEAARPELGHSVHVEVSGLKPGVRYWYRFFSGQATSRAGTVRTTPAPGASAQRVRIGVAGCQHYEAGLYTAYQHLSREPELDAIFHYGDYIYEGPSSAGCPVSSTGAQRTRACFRSHVGEEIYSLDDYRRRYAQYKTDPDLQAAHAAAAFLPSYDDHEIDNNWAGHEDQDGTPPAVFRLRRQAAMQAWYENMPVRRSQWPLGSSVRMHRRLDYGDLLRIHVLDTRQYRSGQICNGQTDRIACRPRDDASHPSILGAAQAAWLEEGLGGGARWNLLAQQVMVMPMLYPASRAAGRSNADSWSGYPASRERLIRAITERGLTNVVIATGDVHKHHVGVLPSREGAFDSAPAATEFVCTSISSDGNGVQLPADWINLPADNPHCSLHDGRRGYQVFDIGRDVWRTDVKVVDKVTTPGGQVSTVATFAVDRHRPGGEKV